MFQKLNQSMFHQLWNINVSPHGTNKKYLYISNTYKSVSLYLFNSHFSIDILVFLLRFSLAQTRGFHPSSTSFHSLSVQGMGDPPPLFFATPILRRESREGVITPFSHFKGILEGFRMKGGRVLWVKVLKCSPRLLNGFFYMTAG